MAKKPLNAKNLAALGADRLAALLLEITKGNASAKRRLRLELAGVDGPAQAAVEIRKRLTTLAGSQAFIDWQGRNAFAADLDGQRRAIVEQVGRKDPKIGWDLIWQFVALANGIYERCDDSTGRVQGVFHTACEDLIDLAESAAPDPVELADRLAEALRDDDYGHYPTLIPGLAPILGPSGLRHLKSRIDAPGTGGSDIYVLRHALEQIADAEGDVDGYIAQHSSRARKVPQIAAQIAHRLLKAGRVDEAWAAINAADPGGGDRDEYDWEETRIGILNAMGRQDEAQSFRWQCFTQSLSLDHLRAYLKQLPDFEDVEAEERAMRHVIGFPDVHMALQFLILWPSLDHAAKLVRARRGNQWRLL